MPYCALLERTVPLSRARVFARLVDFGDVAKLAPDEVESVELEGDGIGSVRTVRVKGVPGPLQERLEAAIDGRMMSYSIINETPLPFVAYHAVVELADAPNGGCTIRWGSNWIAKGASEDDVRNLVTGLYARLIDGIVKLG
ncbi:MAG: SRPBCC family protein [Candidatus Binatia bacterium]